MRKIYPLFLVLLFSACGYSQTGAIPTVREVYDFAAGDTFEYYITSNIDSDVYYMSVVELKIKNDDSIVYVTKGVTLADGAFQKDVTSTSVLCLDSGYYKPWIYTGNILDSWQVANNTNDTIYLARMHSDYSMYCDDAQGYVNGSVKIVGQCKPGIGATDTYKCFTGAVCSNCTDTYLIYYHKTNGATGGTPYDFAAAIDDFIKDLDIRIFPNPTSNNFQLQLSSDPPAGMRLQIFDTQGNVVKQDVIHSLTTKYDRGNLINGLYFWQVTVGDDLLQKGQLILQ